MVCSVFVRVQSVAGSDGFLSSTNRKDLEPSWSLEKERMWFHNTRSVVRLSPSRVPCITGDIIWPPRLQGALIKPWGQGMQFSPRVQMGEKSMLNTDLPYPSDPCSRQEDVHPSATLLDGISSFHTQDASDRRTAHICTHRHMQTHMQAHKHRHTHTYKYIYHDSPSMSFSLRTQAPGGLLHYITLQEFGPTGLVVVEGHTQDICT